MPAIRSSSPEDVKPYSDTRQARKSTKAVKSEPGEATPKGAKSAASRLPDGCKRALAHAVITAGLKNLPHDVAAELSGLTVAQVRKQLESGRGVRRALVDFADTLGP